MNTGLDQYMDIFKDAVEDSAAKLTKSFEKNTYRGDNFVHGNTKKDKFHPNGKVWLAC